MRVVLAAAMLLVTVSPVYASSDQDAAATDSEVVVDPVMAARLACIARVESNNDPNATNRYSKAAGLYQFLWSTWATTPQGRAGLSPYDPVAATAAAEWMIRQGRVREWVAVSGGWCW